MDICMASDEESHCTGCNDVLASISSNEVHLVDPSASQNIFYIFSLQEGEEASDEDEVKEEA